MQNLYKFFFGNKSENATGEIAIATLRKALMAFDNASNGAFYVIDLEKQDFFYKSRKLTTYLAHHGNAACGSTLEQFLHCIPDADMVYGQGFGPKFRDLFNSMADTEKYSLVLSGNFHIPLERGNILVHERVTPIAEDAYGNLRLMLCTLTWSSYKQAGCVQITKGHGEEKQIFLAHENDWLTKGEVELNEREKEVLNLASRGFSTDEIADEMALSKESVKKYRKSILEKTHTESITQAIIRAQNLGII